MGKVIFITILLIGAGWYVMQQSTSVHITPATNTWDRIVTNVVPTSTSAVEQGVAKVAHETTKNIVKQAEETKKEVQTFFDESVHTVRTQVYDKAASGAQEALQSLRTVLGLDMSNKQDPKMSGFAPPDSTNGPVIIFENPNQQTQSVAPMTTVQDQQQLPVSVCAFSKKEQSVKFGIKVSVASPQEQFTGRVEWGDGLQSQTLPVRSDSATIFEHRYEHSGTFTISIIIEDGKNQYRSYKLACIE
jgi:hypothetical protein